MSVLEFACPCGRHFIAGRAAPGQSRGRCAACGREVSEEMEARALDAREQVSEARHRAELAQQKRDIERWGSLENKAFWDHFIACDGLPYVKVGLPRACSLCGAEPLPTKGRRHDAR